MWTLRKFYAGNGGCLPPTDPRILNMTPEQIDLEFAHIVLDKKEKDGETYTDDEYDKYDEETEQHDSMLSDMPVGIPQTDPYAGLKVRNQDEDEWEDFEIED